MSYKPAQIRLLHSGLVLASMLLLSACEKPTAAQAPAAAYVGIDVTGIDCCKALSLMDPTGATRTLAEFKGKAVMVFFGFTQCPDVCPTTLTRAMEVRRLLGKDTDKVQVVFITVDPERDTPGLLKDYMSAFDPSFVALRGDAAATAATAKEFKIFYMKVPTKSSYSMDHTALSYVFDPMGRPRLAIKHEQSAQDLASDLKNLLRDSS